MSGLTSYHAGLAAEDAVARVYHDLGFSEQRRRWRGPGGEIDLILADGTTTIFVEVKKAKSFTAAASRVTARQIGRISASAEAYLGASEAGALSDARVDVALVDSAGAVEILENVTLH